MMRYISNCSYFSMVAILLFLGLLLASLEITSVQSIGVCYGMLGNNLPSQQEVVELYRSRNIAKMRIYNPDQGTLQALSGSNIEVILGVPNPDLQLLASDASAANAWVQRNIRDYPSVRFKYVAVGNEVNPSDLNAANILPAMRNIYNAIVSAVLQNQTKVSTVIDTGLLGESYPPSRGAFRANVRSFIDPIIAFLVTNRAPLLANVYPYFSHVGNPTSVPLDYALFRSNIVNQDGQLQYRNLFDAIVDALYSALEKAGGLTLEIVISETGWPSAGGAAATIDNARTYNQNLINYVKGGTPKRSGRPIDTYVFAMFNENGKSTGIEQNFGLFFPNKQPVYPIDFSSVPSPNLPTFLLSCESCCHGSNLVIQLT